MGASSACSTTGLAREARGMLLANKLWFNLARIARIQKLYFGHVNVEAQKHFCAAGQGLDTGQACRSYMCAAYNTRFWLIFAYFFFFLNMYFDICLTISKFFFAQAYSTNVNNNYRRWTYIGTPNIYKFDIRKMFVLIAVPSVHIAYH